MSRAVKRYRKKPVIVEAIQWNGQNHAEIEGWSGRRVTCGRLWATIETNEGEMLGEIGDWIIRGVKGEFYPCKPDVFAMTYKEVSP